MCVISLFGGVGGVVESPGRLERNLNIITSPGHKPVSYVTEFLERLERERVVRGFLLSGGMMRRIVGWNYETLMMRSETDTRDGEEAFWGGLF